MAAKSVGVEVVTEPAEVLNSTQAKGMFFSWVGATIARDNKCIPGTCSTAMVVSWSCKVQSDDVACHDGLPDDGANISLRTIIVQVAMI